MEVDVTPGPRKLRVGLSGMEEIIQNVGTIMDTPKGTVPLDRTFGVEGRFLDKPERVAQAMYVAEIVSEVEKLEPRVKVTRVQWREDPQGAQDGKLIPVVRIRIREGVL